MTPATARAPGLPWTPVAGVLGLALLAAGCAPAPEPPPRLNVILILVDTLRADHLGAYGYERPTSPHFDALAAESYLFEDARAQAPCTFPSVNSLLTGRLPGHFLGRPKLNLSIPEGIPSLAEVLRDTGYSTAAVSASPIVRATPSDHNPDGGFGRGFGHFEESCEWQEARCVRQRATSLLDGAELPEPFFLYLHYLDPHDPYRPPAEWPRSFTGDGRARRSGASAAAANGDPNPMAQALYSSNDPSLATPESLASLIDRYDEEIAYFDHELGKLLVQLHDRKLLERSILLIVSDHGEEFFEHRHLKHCRALFDTELRTPMLIRLPPGTASGPPRRVEAQVANLDVVPTVLELLGVPAEGLGLEGASLLPLMHGASGDGEPGRPPVFAAWGALRAVKDGRFKLVSRLEAGRARLYDLALDPQETRDVAREHPVETRRLSRLASEWRSRVEAERDGNADQEAAERLRSLGYLQ